MQPGKHQMMKQRCLHPGPCTTFCFALITHSLHDPYRGHEDSCAYTLRLYTAWITKPKRNYWLVPQSEVNSFSVLVRAKKQRTKTYNKEHCRIIIAISLSFVLMSCICVNSMRK